MRILYLITGLRLGGAEKQLLLLSKQMQLAGNEILVVAMQSDGIMKDEFTANDIKVVELGVKGIGNLISTCKNFKKVVTDFPPDIIHAHMIHANIFSAFFKLLNRKYKLVCTAHNIKEGSRATMAAYYLARNSANWATNVSSEAFNLFIRRRYFKANRSSFIPNAIDTQVFSPDNYNKYFIRRQLHIPEDAYVFFSAGRLHYQKNYPALLKAFILVKKAQPDALLYIAGEGPELSALKALGKELGIDNCIFFLGRRNDIPALMAMSDCFVLSSDFEGFGLVIAEAMAMQLPVICTDCGGVKEVMGGLGTLVKVGDIEGLSNAMIAIGAYGHQQNNLNMRHHIEEHYSIPVVMNKWTQLYNSL